MPQFDELLGVVTFAAAGMIAAVSLVPVPSSTPAELPVVSAAAASTSPAPVAHQPKT